MLSSASQGACKARSIQNNQYSQNQESKRRKDYEYVRVSSPRSHTCSDSSFIVKKAGSGTLSGLGRTFLPIRVSRVLEFMLYSDCEDTQGSQLQLSGTLKSLHFTLGTSEARESQPEYRLAQQLLCFCSKVSGAQCSKSKRMPNRTQHNQT